MTYNKVTTNFATVFDEVKNADLIIVEGFEFVGKNEVVENIKSEFKFLEERPVLSYRPNYDNINYLEIITNPAARFVLRYPILEFIKELKKLQSDATLILDKSIFTDLMYIVNNNKQLPPDSVAAVLHHFHHFIRNYNVAIIHTTYSTVDESLLMEKSKLISAYNSVEQYFEDLTRADARLVELFSQYLSMYGNEKIKIVKYYPR